MSPQFLRVQTMRQRILSSVFVTAVLFSFEVPTAQAANGTVLADRATRHMRGSNPFEVIPPVFTDPDVKIAQLSSSSFSQMMFDQALQLEPLIGKPGVQVNMGFWSGIRSMGSNHGSLVRLLDSVNSFNADSSQMGPQLTVRAIWDEGVGSSTQYPLYMLQINEFWYERSSLPITIRGQQYPSKYFVDFAKADQIWGLYSQRYADMATIIRQKTGRVPNVWCYVSGARATRIFYKFELPELVALEAQGDVKVYFAFTQEANWLSLNDWAAGTDLAPKPLPSRLRRLLLTSAHNNTVHTSIL